MVNCEGGKCNCTKAALLVSGILFALIAACHLWRVIQGNAVQVDGNAVPNWVSVVAIAVSAIMAIWNFCSVCCKKCQYCKKCQSGSCSPTLPK
jgi:hypothetical protein